MNGGPCRADARPRRTPLHIAASIPAVDESVSHAHVFGYSTITMRILRVGGLRNQPRRAPVSWSGLEIHSLDLQFQDIVRFNQHTPMMMPRVNRQRLSSFVEGARRGDAVLCETPEALILHAEWRRLGHRPRPLLALEVEGLLRVNAMQRWYRRMGDPDPWPFLRAEPAVSWLAASEIQGRVLHDAGVPAERIFPVRGCTAYFGMFSAQIESQFAGPAEGDADLARGLPTDGVLLPGGGRRDLVTMLRAVQKLPDLRFFLIDELLPRKIHLLKQAGISKLPNLFSLRPLPLERFIALVRRARMVVVALEPGRGDGGHTTVATAHRLGVPVITSDVPGVVDYVTHGQDALVVPPEDPEALAAAIRALWTGPAMREKLAEGGRRQEQLRCQAAAPQLWAAIEAAVEDARRP